jgi:hypothetical protein
MKIVSLAFAALALAGCSSEAHLHYAPSGAPAVAPEPTIAQVSVTDDRGEDPHYLATVRNGFGSPVKIRKTTDTVAAEVTGVAIAALKARGLYDPTDGGAYEIDLTIRQFDANQLVHREAVIDLEMDVVSRSNRDVVYRDQVKDSKQNLELFDAGVFADTDKLQALAEQVLSEAVDQLVDKPAFRRAVQAPAPQREMN